MRAVRVLGLVIMVAAAGLLSGAAAGAAPTTSALVAAAAGALPDGVLVAPSDVGVPAAEPAVLPAPAPAAAPVAVPAVPVALPAPVVRKPAPAAVPQPAAARALTPGTPCLSSARACIDLSENKTWLIRNGAVEYGPVPITHGRKGFRTPPGTFSVTFKSKNHRSSLFNDAPMPNSVFFNGGIAFHQGSLKILSHGCIHLSKAASQAYFGALSRGDVVQVVR